MSRLLEPCLPTPFADPFNKRLKALEKEQKVQRKKRVQNDIRRLKQTMSTNDIGSIQKKVSPLERRNSLIAGLLEPAPASNVDHPLKRRNSLAPNREMSSYTPLLQKSSKHLGQTSLLNSTAAPRIREPGTSSFTKNYGFTQAMVQVKNCPAILESISSHAIESSNQHAARSSIVTSSRVDFERDSNPGDVGTCLNLNFKQLPTQLAIDQVSEETKENLPTSSRRSKDSSRVKEQAQTPGSAPSSRQRIGSPPEQIHLKASGLQIINNPNYEQMSERKKRRTIPVDHRYLTQNNELTEKKLSQLTKSYVQAAPSLDDHFYHSGQTRNSKQITRLFLIHETRSSKESVSIASLASKHEMMTGDEVSSRLPPSSTLSRDPSLSQKTLVSTSSQQRELLQQLHPNLPKLPYLNLHGLQNQASLEMQGSIKELPIEYQGSSNSVQAEEHVVTGTDQRMTPTGEQSNIDQFESLEKSAPSSQGLEVRVLKSSHNFESYSDLSQQRRVATQNTLPMPERIMTKASLQQMPSKVESRLASVHPSSQPSLELDLQTQLAIMQSQFEMQAATGAQGSHALGRILPGVPTISEVAITEIDRHVSSPSRAEDPPTLPSNPSFERATHQQFVMEDLEIEPVLQQRAETQLAPPLKENLMKKSQYDTPQFTEARSNRGLKPKLGACKVASPLASMKAKEAQGQADRGPAIRPDEREKLSQKSNEYLSKLKCLRSEKAQPRLRSELIKPSLPKPDSPGLSTSMISSPSPSPQKANQIQKFKQSAKALFDQREQKHELVAPQSEVDIIMNCIEKIRSKKNKQEMDHLVLALSSSGIVPGSDVSQLFKNPFVTRPGTPIKSFNLTPDSCEPPTDELQDRDLIDEEQMPREISFIPGSLSTTIPASNEGYAANYAQKFTRTDGFPPSTGECVARKHRSASQAQFAKIMSPQTTQSWKHPQKTLSKMSHPSSRAVTEQSKEGGSPSQICRVFKKPNFVTPNGQSPLAKRRQAGPLSVEGGSHDLAMSKKRFSEMQARMFIDSQTRLEKSLLSRTQALQKMPSQSSMKKKNKRADTESDCLSMQTASDKTRLKRSPSNFQRQFSRKGKSPKKSPSVLHLKQEHIKFARKRPEVRPKTSMGSPLKGRLPIQTSKLEFIGERVDTRPSNYERSPFTSAVKNQPAPNQERKMVENQLPPRQQVGRPPSAANMNRPPKSRDIKPASKPNSRPASSKMNSRPCSVLSSKQVSRENSQDKEDPKQRIKSALALDFWDRIFEQKKRGDPGPARVQSASTAASKPAEKYIQMLKATRIQQQKKPLEGRNRVVKQNTMFDGVRSSSGLSKRPIYHSSNSFMKPK